MEQNYCNQFIIFCSNNRAHCSSWGGFSAILASKQSQIGLSGDHQMLMTSFVKLDCPDIEAGQQSPIKHDFKAFQDLLDENYPRDVG